MSDQVFTCPIWGTLAKQSHARDYDARVTIESPRAGGTYELTDSARAMLPHLSEDRRIKLTDWIVNQNRLSRIPPVINSDVLHSLERLPDLSISERRDRLLHLLNHNIKKIGDAFIVGMTVSEQRQKHINELLAWTGSIQESEVWYLVNACVEAGLVENNASKFLLTPKGYDYLAEIGTRRTSSDQAFVAMWFNDSMNDAYEKGFEPAISDAGYKPFRIDRKEHINKIDDEIVAEIRRSRFLVADFTARLLTVEDTAVYEARGGVYFEAGFAYGLNIPVIWTCRTDVANHIHFDTRQFNHILWSDPQSLRGKLYHRIGAVIGDGPLKQGLATN